MHKHIANPLAFLCKALTMPILFHCCCMLHDHCPIGAGVEARCNKIAMDIIHISFTKQEKACADYGLGAKACWDDLYIKSCSLFRDWGGLRHWKTSLYSQHTITQKRNSFFGRTISGCKGVLQNKLEEQVWALGRAAQPERDSNADKLTSKRYSRASEKLLSNSEKSSIQITMGVHSSLRAFFTGNLSCRQPFKTTCTH